jgi:hypothetical protein
MKKLLFGLAALPFIAGIASAADRLGDAQMDRITAGNLPSIDCPTCILSSSTSISNNGVTVAMSITTGPTSGGTIGGGGAFGGGGTTGGGGSQGGGTNSGILSAGFIANIVQLAGFNPVSP